MIFRTAGVPPALFRGSPSVVLKLLSYRWEPRSLCSRYRTGGSPCFAVKFCLTGGSLLIYQGEPDFSPAKKCSLSGEGFSPGIY